MCLLTLLVDYVGCIYCVRLIVWCLITVFDYGAVGSSFCVMVVALGVVGCELIWAAMEAGCWFGFADAVRCWCSAGMLGFCGLRCLSGAWECVLICGFDC